MRGLIRRGLAGLQAAWGAGFRRDDPGHGAMMERLEPRTFLSADLPSEPGGIDDAPQSPIVLSAQDIGVATGSVDLSVVVVADKFKLPAAPVTSGAGTKLSIPLLVTNHGTDAVPTGATAIARVFAVPSGETVGTAVGDAALRVGGIKGGASKPFTISFTLPAGLAGGSYVFRVELDATGAVAETDEENNAATTPGSAALAVTRGFVDLAIASVAPGLPPAVVSGVGAKGKVVVNVTNLGNVSLPKGQQVRVEVLLRPRGAADGSGDVAIGELPALAAGGLKPNAVKKATLAVNVAGATTNGEYDMIARVTPVQGLTEESLANNVATPNASVVVADPFVDLSGVVNSKLKLPATPVTSGAGVKLSIPVDVRNQGNVPIAAGTTVTAQVIARLAGEASGTVVGEAPLKVGGLKPGLAKPFTLPFLLPPGLAGGAYVFDVKLDSGQQLAESNEDNNTTTTPQGLTLNVVRGFVDIAPVLISATLPDNVVAGTGAGGKVVAALRNDGNVPLPATQQVSVQLVLRPTDAAPGDASRDHGIGGVSNFALGGLKPGVAKNVTLDAAIGALVTTGEYNLLLHVAPVQTLTEESVANNTLVTGEVIDVAGANVQVGMLTAITSFGGTGAGAAGGTGSVILSNGGNVRATGTVDVSFVARLASDPSQETVLGTRTGVAVNLNPGAASPTVQVPITLPAVLDNPVDYVVEARITGASLNLANAGGLQTVVIGAVNVTPAPPNGASLIGTVTFTQTQILDQTINVFGTRAGQVVSLGRFTTQAGRTGAYTWTLAYAPAQAGVNDDAHLILSFDGSPSLLVEQLKLDFEVSRPESLQGRSIQFLEAAGGSSGSYDTAGQVFYKGGIITLEGWFKLT